MTDEQRTKAVAAACGGYKVAPTVKARMTRLLRGLEAEIAELRKDKARLDWIMSNVEIDLRAVCRLADKLAVESGVDLLTVTNYSHWKLLAYRQLIDEAMEGK